MLEPALVLGIDCGGTKTLALLATPAGQVIGRGDAGSSNTNLVGKPGVLAAIDQAVTAAFAQAGIPRRAVAALCVGMAGVDRPAEKEWFTRSLMEAGLAARIEISNDARLLLAAGTPDGWGLGAIAGTGSIVYGITPDGRYARAGGWGYVLGDEGSGYDIGRQALRAVVRAHDGRAPATGLTRRILEVWALEKADQLIPYVYQRPTPPFEIAELAPLVGQAAADGDAVAAAILAGAVEELALGLVTVTRRLDFPAEVPCAFGGGVLVHMPGLRAQVIARAHADGTILDPAAVVDEPVLGAVRIACTLAGVV